MDEREEDRGVSEGAAYNQADILFWLRHRGSAFGEGRQVVSEALLDSAAAEIERLQARVAGLGALSSRAMKKASKSADIIRRNYLHQPEKCDDARQFCAEIVAEISAALGELPE